MTTGLLHLHSFLRWLALIAIVLSIVQSARVFTGSHSFAKRDQRWALLTLVFFHLQLVVGLVLYFTQGWYRQLGDLSNSIIRFFALEHLVLMLLAIALVTVGYSRSKRIPDDRRKLRTLFWYYVVALVLVLIGIPWPFREVGLGRTWFPGM